MYKLYIIMYSVVNVFDSCGPVPVRVFCFLLSALPCAGACAGPAARAISVMAPVPHHCAGGTYLNFRLRARAVDGP